MSHEFPHINMLLHDDMSMWPISRKHWNNNTIYNHSSVTGCLFSEARLWKCPLRFNQWGWDLNDRNFQKFYCGWLPFPQASLGNLASDYMLLMTITTCTVLIHISRNKRTSSLTWPVQRPTTRSAMKLSSVSPLRCDTITPQPAACAILHAWIDSDTEPIWFTFSSSALQALRSIASFTFFGFVTVKSSL